MPDHLEIEQKFDVDEDFKRPDFGALAAAVPGGATEDAPVTYQLAATYFDTPDERLAANKITLRRRTCCSRLARGRPAMAPSWPVC